MISPGTFNLKFGFAFAFMSNCTSSIIIIDSEFEIPRDDISSSVFDVFDISAALLTPNV